MTVVRHQLSFKNLPVRAFEFRAQGFSPPLARRPSSCAPPSPNLVRTHPIENYQALRDSPPCLSRAATLPKGTKLELGRGAHLGTPSSANHTAAAFQPTGRIAKAVSWLHLSRVSPALQRPREWKMTGRFYPWTYGGRGGEGAVLVGLDYFIPGREVRIDRQIRFPDFEIFSFQTSKKLEYHFLTVSGLSVS